MNKQIIKLLEKPQDEWDEKDEKLYKKFASKKISLSDLLNNGMADWNEEDDDNLEELKRKSPRKKLPDNVIVLPYEESMMDPGVNAEPYTYTVKKGDTLKKISELHSVSYGELSNHLLSTEGTTSIFEGQSIKIPRHFVDLSHAA